MRDTDKISDRQIKRARTWTWIIVGYSIGTLIWLILWFLVGDRFWPVLALDDFFPVLFFPLPVLALWTALARGPRWLWLVLLIPLLVFVGFYYPYLVPTWARSEDQKDPLSSVPPSPIRRHLSFVYSCPPSWMAFDGPPPSAG